MKHIVLSVALLLALSVALVACSKKSNPTTTVIVPTHTPTAT